MNDSIKKWRVFLASEPRMDPKAAIVPELTPFFGTPLFEALSEEEKSRLYWYFLAFQAEAFVALEELLMIALRRLRDKGPDAEREKILKEEFFHSQAFLKMLRGMGPLNWPEDSVFLRSNSRLKNAMAGIAKRSPYGVALPSAKLEVYTIAYGRYAARFYSKDHPWHQLHLAHISDELGHVVYDFDLYGRAMEGSWRERWAVIGWSLLLTLLLQVMLLRSCLKILQKSFPQSRFWTRQVLSLRFFRWVLRSFPPYTQTRTNLRNHMGRRELRYRRLFSFMHW